MSVLIASPLCKLSSPVFITGIPRSGTTLLYRTFLEHSTFKPQPVDNSNVSLLIESNAFMHPNAVFLDERADKYLLLNQSVKRLFLDSVSGIKPYQRPGNFLYRNTLPRTSSTVLRSLTFKMGLNHFVLRRYFHHAQKARNTKRILEKTPDHINRLPEIKATYPHAKCMFMYRHPVDVLSSYRKRLELAKEIDYEESKKSWLKISVGLFCNLYRGYINLALKEKRQNPENFIMIKFEDMADNPSQCLQEVCSFLQEPFEETIVPTGKSSGKANFSSFLGGKVTRSTKRWEDFLQLDDAQLLEHELSDIMKDLGYLKYTGSNTE